MYHGKAVCEKLDLFNNATLVIIFHTMTQQNKNMTAMLKH